MTTGSHPVLVKPHPHPHLHPDRPPPSQPCTSNRLKQVMKRGRLDQSILKPTLATENINNNYKLRRGTGAGSRDSSDGRRMVEKANRH